MAQTLDDVIGKDFNKIHHAFIFDRETGEFEPVEDDKEPNILAFSIVYGSQTDEAEEENNVVSPEGRVSASHTNKSEDYVLNQEAVYLMQSVANGLELNAEAEGPFYAPYVSPHTHRTILYSDQPWELGLGQLMGYTNPWEYDVFLVGTPLQLNATYHQEPARKVEKHEETHGLAPQESEYFVRVLNGDPQ